MPNNLVDDFLSYLSINKNRSRATIDAYRPMLLRLQVFLAGRGKKLLQADMQDLELWAGPELHQAGLDAATRSKAISAVRGFFRWAYRTGLIPRNTAEALDHPRLPQNLPTSFTLEQAEQLIWAPDLDTFKGVRDAAILSMLIGTGCRVSGLVALNESDIFTDTVDGVKWVYINLKEKGKKTRQVPLPKLAVVPLLMYMGHDDRKALDDGRHHLRIGEGDRVLWCNIKPGGTPLHEWYGEGRRISRHGVLDLVKWYGRQVGIPEALLHPHAARHMMGTRLYDEGIDKEDRKAFLGHESDKTLSIYTRTSRRRLLQVAGKANPLAAIKTPFDALAEVVSGPAPASVRPRTQPKHHKGK